LIRSHSFQLTHSLTHSLIQREREREVDVHCGEEGLAYSRACVYRHVNVDEFATGDALDHSRRQQLRHACKRRKE